MIFDAHVHLPSPKWPGHSCEYASVEAAIAHLREAGIDRAIFTLWQGVFAETEEDLNIANSEALRLMTDYPDFLLPGAVIHPAYPDASMAWLKRFREAGVKWIGELVEYKCGLAFDEPAWMRLFEYCAEQGHILQLHNSEAILSVADRFPKMTVICSHIHLDLLDGLAERANIWLDMSGGTGGFTPGALEKALVVFGPDRILFGTDFTGYEPAAFIERVNDAVDDSDCREKIFYQNLTTLLESNAAESS